jgi:hypothetical protein
MCLHTDGDTQPLCELCSQAIVWRRLILDVALGRVTVPDDFIDSIGEDPPID